MLSQIIADDILFLSSHNEYMPIQIYWKFYHQKLKTYR